MVADLDALPGNTELKTAAHRLIAPAVNVTTHAYPRHPVRRCMTHTSGTIGRGSYSMWYPIWYVHIYNHERFRITIAEVMRLLSLDYGDNAALVAERSLCGSPHPSGHDAPDAPGPMHGASAIGIPERDEYYSYELRDW